MPPTLGHALTLAPLLLDGSAAQPTQEDNGASALSSSTARSHSSASSSASASCEPTVIRQRGSHVSELRKATGAVIDVEKDESGAGTVTLSGEPMAVDAARSAIEALLHRAD
ncbi:hypothetical protein EMIHUDRAFT_457154 [Emiliania huxleyi CCMP1516]|uniref:K Homology domain-containing protein n=2 Tax=Emiliania huxleyi TaxID=2903 RepID=A0A0D3JVH7_EMIH1|nr:hypothetical protein EMIHUDRAFT_457154 [Emiliania huxleyi CCMP1516]EOD27512.1 hypothetical protein EMIHUDRAFT_457154 [Emiliania huxleyi CCMP1516]|eukprot:XP_005779941.1 hypothetical protein EMIHUDRAFT_457154 [Emiliania huxleyi CCMP1516]